jgi:hypothetical protein
LSIEELTLTLLEAGIFLVDDIQAPFATNNFTIDAALFY